MSFCLLLLISLTFKRSMSARKASRRQNHNSHAHIPANNQNHNHNHLRNPSLSHIHLLQPSDYESDTAYDSSVPGPFAAPPPPPRTNEQLNLSVIQRHSPSVYSILSISPYSVVYTFNASNSSWEKSGIEGSLFVCQLYPGTHGEDRYAAIVLNRRGLENFEAELRQEADVEITEDFSILKIQSPDAGEAEKIIGLWIFSEPAPSSTSETRAVHGRLIKECATSAGESRQQAEQNAQAWANQNGHARHLTEDSWNGPGPTAATSQVMVQDPFQQQSQHNNFQNLSNWMQGTEVQYTVQARQLPQNHSSHWNEPEPYQPGEWQFRQNVRHAQPDPAQGQTHQSLPLQQEQSQVQHDILGELFRRAGFGYQGP